MPIAIKHKLSLHFVLRYSQRPQVHPHHGHQPEVYHQAYAKHLLSLHFLLNVSRPHQCFDFLNVVRCIHTMGIVVNFDHLQLRKANRNKGQCSRIYINYRRWACNLVCTIQKDYATAHNGKIVAFKPYKFIVNKVHQSSKKSGIVYLIESRVPCQNTFIL